MTEPERLASVLAMCACLAAGCATNPVTGKRELALVSEAQEIAMGRDADKEVSSAYGLYPDQRLQEYVQALGTRIAAKTERPDLPWTFRVVDDAAVNAFAIPGGFIYVTRGILTHLNSEAELATILGHEIGHVTARHSVNQMSKQQLAQIGLVAGMVLSPQVARFGNLAQTGLGLMFLQFSRSDESQSDELGLKYMTSAGYDPREMVDVFRMLAGREPASRRRPPAAVALQPSRPREPGGVGRQGRGVGQRVRPDGQPRAVHAPAGRDGVRREPARGFLRRMRLPPPRPGVQDVLPAGVEGQQPEAGRRGGQPQRGRDRRAAARGGQERGAGGAAVRVAGGHPHRAGGAARDRRLPRRVPAVPGPGRAGDRPGHGRVGRVRGARLPGLGLHDAGAMVRLRACDHAFDRQLLPRDGSGGPRSTAEPAAPGGSPAPDDAGHARAGVPLDGATAGGRADQRHPGQRDASRPGRCSSGWWAGGRRNGRS